MKSYIEEYDKKKKLKQMLANKGTVLKRVGSSLWQEAKRGAKVYHEYSKPEARLKRAKKRLQYEKMELENYKIRKQLEDLKLKRRGL